MCTHLLMRITRQVKNVLQNKARNYHIIYYFYFIFVKNMDFAAWFDDVRRMNKRQVSRFSYFASVVQASLHSNATCLSRSGFQV